MHTNFSAGVELEQLVGIHQGFAWLFTPFERGDQMLVCFDSLLKVFFSPYLQPVFEDVGVWEAEVLQELSVIEAGGFDQPVGA